jgi:hypothetical protein
MDKCNCEYLLADLYVVRTDDDVEPMFRHATVAYEKRVLLSRSSSSRLHVQHSWYAADEGFVVLLT